LENQGVEVELYWPLVQYTIFAVQAGYEEGITELDEPIDRALEINNVYVTQLCGTGNNFNRQEV